MGVSLGDLADVIDRLCIVNLKIWHLEEAIRDDDLSDAEVGRITRRLTPLNEERALLKNRINEITGGGGRDEKIYIGRIATDIPDGS
jgi:hypothetical protein